MIKKESILDVFCSISQILNKHYFESHISKVVLAQAYRLSESIILNVTDNDEPTNNYSIKIGFVFTLKGMGNVRSCEPQNSLQ